LVRSDTGDTDWHRTGRVSWRVSVDDDAVHQATVKPTFTIVFTFGFAFAFVLFRAGFSGTRYLWVSDG